MQCPLCGGPLHIEQPDLFACERGHQLGNSELTSTVAARVTIAFWMAIEALESEAEVLKLVPPDQGGNEDLAARAAQDARLLRELAAAHVVPLTARDDGR